jgi:mono/diheme cytochrome c family protein
VLGCVVCHGLDLGGASMQGGTLVGRLWAPNLTRGRGGLGSVYTTEDWARVVRHGVARDGRGLLYMRARRWAHLSEGDLADLVAWFGAMPAVDRLAEPSEPGLALPLVLALGDGVDAARVDDATPSRVPYGPTAAYGRYLAELAGCHDCHGPELRGGRVPWGNVPAPELSATAIPDWNGAVFAAALVRGRAHDGHVLDPTMPWIVFAGLTDTEIDALWLHVRGDVGAAVADGRDP